MVDRRRSLHEELIATARAQFPMILKTEVPYWSEIERMSVRRAPLPACAPRSDGALIYTALWTEIRKRIEPGRRASALACRGGHEAAAHLHLRGAAHGLDPHS